uniref:NADH dehydrogenase subunit 4L n=1 Tax=Tauphaedusa stearnsii iriomotensis TaxID=1885684 RepID=A0A224A2C0_9EUPU|nr:NADH dehydrogenase subunit 4L [Tauphaedusa stearnsii iriomotensis]
MIYLLNIYTLLLMVFHVVFFNSKNHFLSSLLLMEGMVLISILITLSVSYIALEGLTFFLLVLTFSGVEASFALTLLISFSKLNGNDVISSFSILSKYS